MGLGDALGGTLLDGTGRAVYRLAEVLTLPRLWVGTQINPHQPLAVTTPNYLSWHLNPLVLRVPLI